MISDGDTLKDFKHVRAFSECMRKGFPYFARTIEKRVAEFGIPWLKDFENELTHFFGEDRERLEAAVAGYGRFALDSMKLQKKFDLERRYISRTYEEAVRDVYLSREYMFRLYLPGILISQYLWPHHYRQLHFFRESFLAIPDVASAGLFYDVGVGTGFFSKEMLICLPEVRGRGYDISPHSLEHTMMMLERWNVADRYEAVRRDILKDPPAADADALVCVEVLEHLEEPVAFLRGLRNLLRPGALAFITAAINAPNADHIYLYSSLSQLIDEIHAAGFTVVESREYTGYTPKPGESVPSNGACIVRKEACA